MAVKPKRDSFNRTRPKNGLVRLPTDKVDGAIFLKPEDTITLEDVKEEDIFPEANGNVVFDPNEGGSENLVKDPSIYGDPTQQGYGDVVFDPN